MKKNNTRARNFVLLLYPENVEHIKTMEYLKRNYSIAYALHSKDVAYTKGEVERYQNLKDEDIRKILSLAPSSEEVTDVVDFDKTENVDISASLKNFLRIIGNTDFMRDIDGKLTICDTEVKFNETGDLLKKEHWHVVLKLGTNANARSASAVAKELGISENFIQCCSNVKGALTYLIHYGDKSKYQYEIFNVEGDPKMIAELEELVYVDEDLTEDQCVALVFSTVNNYQGIMPYEEFIALCLMSGETMKKTYRKYASGLYGLWKEHNQRIRDEQNARELDALAKKR